MRYAVINSATGLVDNVILLADPAQWPVPSGHQIVQSDTGNVGDTWNGAGFVSPPASAPPPPYVPPTPRQWLERLSMATQLGLETAAMSNAQVALWLRKATGAGSIDVTLQETKDGVAAMVAAALLTAAEQTVLLTP